MAGIIASVKDSKAVEEQGEPKLPPGQEQQEEAAELTPQAVRGQMQIPPELQDTYDRLVMAGKKVLYSEAMAPQIQELLRGEGELGEKLGQGVVALLAMLIDKSNGTLPPQLIIPAGVELVVEAGNFLKDAGQKVTKEDIAEGTAVLVGEILQRAGVSMDQLPQLLSGQQGAPEAETPEETMAEGGVEEPGQPSMSRRA